MIKKLAAVGVGAALFLAAAVPAFAGNLTIRNSGTDILNDVTTQANTGFNQISWPWTGGGIWTGNASAVSQVGNQVNTTRVDTCGCSNNVTVTNEDTDVGNLVLTQANTGFNTVGGTDPDDPPLVGGIHTGAASAVGAVTNVVNTTVVGGIAL